MAAIPTINIDVRVETSRLVSLHSALSSKEVKKAIYRAINYAITRTRVQMKRDIKSVYNINQSLINNEVMTLSKAGSNNLTGKINADIWPISLEKFNPRAVSGSVITRIGAKGNKVHQAKGAQRKQGVFVEIVKNQKKWLPSAFMLMTKNGLKIVARGKYETKGFIFQKARYPLTPFNAKSVFYATQDKAVMGRYAPFAEAEYSKELERQLNLAASQATNTP